MTVSISSHVSRGYVHNLSLAKNNNKNTEKGTKQSKMAGFFFQSLNVQKGILVEETEKNVKSFLLALPQDQELASWGDH